ncbi:hypothetical protein K438DRAFT_1999989 [Mycena galopus ATCC 62051]|nr:hypothetical protein K438DRAFT_1999989 [Mycena galopus ATCC 62051]
MASIAAAALQKVSLVGQHKTAVIVGGTLGIGAAIARHLAQRGCNRIVIFGRNEARGATLEFLKGDVSDSQSMRATVDALQKAGGESGIDYLVGCTSLSAKYGDMNALWPAQVMCQKGLPTGTINENADGIDQAFAIQAISRFAIAYLLTTRGALAPGASLISIMGQGQSLEGLSVDDLSLARRLATGISQTNMFLAQSNRDSSVIDAFTEELNIRYPKYQYYHLTPGLVSSEQFDVNKFPGFMKYALLTAPVTPNRYFDSKLKPQPLGKWAADVRNREALWEKLVSIVGE